MSYTVRRTAHLELFDVSSNVERAEQALNNFLAKCSNPGWAFQFIGDPAHGSLMVVAVLDELQEDPADGSILDQSTGRTGTASKTPSRSLDFDVSGNESAQS